MSIPIIQIAVNEVDFIIKYIEDNIAQYKLSELTNKNMGDIPSIVGAHPLALEYGNMLSADEEGNYTSILPAIGVELADDGDNSPQYLGSAYRVEEVTQDFIDSIKTVEMRDRFSEGIIISDSNLNLIQSAKTIKGDNKLYIKSKTYLSNQSVVVSLWSDNWKVTRILYIVMKGILNELKHSISKEGAKNVVLSSQTAIYNYEFHKTLFGSEFNLRFVNTQKDSEIDDSIIEVSKVDESIVGENNVDFIGKGE